MCSDGVGVTLFVGGGVGRTCLSFLLRDHCDARNAQRGIVIIRCLSVCLSMSVTLMICDHRCWLLGLIKWITSVVFARQSPNFGNLIPREHPQILRGTGVG